MGESDAPDGQDEEDGRDEAGAREIRSLSISLKMENRCRHGGPGCLVHSAYQSFYHRSYPRRDSPLGIDWLRPLLI